MIGTVTAALALAVPAGAQGPTAPVAYERFSSAGKDYHAVTADLRSSWIEADTLYSRELTSAWGLVGRVQPIAAITGTFFAPKNGTPVADVFVNGNLVAKGNRGTVVAVNQLGGIEIRDQNFRRQFDWSSYRSGMRGTVRLISGGKVSPNPKAQSFTDPAIWGNAARTAVGITHHGKVVLVATEAKVTLSDLGRAMLKKGVVDAVSLDGGSSTCLYFNGRMIIGTQRKLTTMVAIKPTALAHASGGVHVLTVDP
jgi:exopolysaccharide biosynthesis protein